MKYKWLVLLLAFIACSKKDVQLYKNYVKNQKCLPISVNSEKQSTNDYYVIRTVDEYGLIRHLKAQLWDLDGNTFIYDYAINYSAGKAIFHGSAKTLYWFLDNPPPQDDNGPFIPPEPGAPRHPVEQVNLRDNRSFEVFFESKTGYPFQVKYVDSAKPELQLSYDKHGVLTGINDYIVSTDKDENIISILKPKPADPYLYGQQLGIHFTYSNNTSKKTNQYYETPYIFIHPLYSLLDVLNWGPFQPHAERTGLSLQRDYEDPELGEYTIPSVWVNAIYTDHQYDVNGNLIGYTFDGDLTRDYPFPLNHETAQLQRKIIWNCNSSLNSRP